MLVFAIIEILNVVSSSRSITVRELFERLFGVKYSVRTSLSRSRPLYVRVYEVNSPFCSGKMGGFQVMYIAVGSSEVAVNFVGIPDGTEKKN